MTAAVTSEAELDALIERMSNGDNDPLAEPMPPSSKEEADARAAELREQMIDEMEAANAVPKPAPDSIEKAMEPAPDIWTLDMLMQRKPLTCDLDDDRKILFHIQPVMGTGYVQKRLAIGAAMKDKDPQGFADTLVAYAEILNFAIIDWPLRETVEDEYGNPLYEEDGKTPKSVPLPKTLDNCLRMDMPLLVRFINAMGRAYRGEARG